MDKCCANKNEKVLDRDFWNSQYLNQKTGWDLGEVSPPIKNYIDQLTHKHISILIPGCGNTYEAAYLLQQGFTNVTVIDIAPALIATLQQKFSDNPHIKIIQGDFFQHEGQYDLIIEQTFFCALNPSLRKEYVAKMKKLLKPEGKLAGVLFSKAFDFEGPPFGGTVNEYLQLFENDFHLKTFDTCYNSVAPRMGNELFICFVKK